MTAKQKSRERIRALRVERRKEKRPGKMAWKKERKKLKKQEESARTKRVADSVVNSPSNLSIGLWWDWMDYLVVWFDWFDSPLDGLDGLY